jgi:hypothetical protein
LCNQINANTTQEITAYPCGYSGNHVGPSPDVLITTPDGNHAIELKTTKKDKFTIASTDIDQLIDCQNCVTSTWFGVDYNNRELLFVYLPNEHQSAQALRERLVTNTPDCFNPRNGRTGTYITDKPSCDDWASKQAGMADWRVVCTLISVGEYIDNGTE